MLQGRFTGSTWTPRVFLQASGHHGLSIFSPHHLLCFIPNYLVVWGCFDLCLSASKYSMQYAVRTAGPTTDVLLVLPTPFFFHPVVPCLACDQRHLFSLDKYRSQQRQVQQIIRHFGALSLGSILLFRCGTDLLQQTEYQCSHPNQLSFDNRFCVAGTEMSFYWSNRASLQIKTNV